MKPETVVVLGPRFGEFPELVARGFRQNGIEAVCLTYPEPPVTPMELLVWEYLPRLRLTALRENWVARILQAVCAACRDAGLLIIIKGDQLPLDQYAELVATVRCPKVVWLMDSVHRVRDGLTRASMADLVFSFEGTDRPILDALPIPHHQVALAVDPDWYHPIDGSRRRWDVSFVGALYENRLSTLESILTAVPAGTTPTGRFVGAFRSHVHPLRTARMLRRYPLTARKLKHGRNLKHEQINRLYNQSQICLNIFHPQSVESVNPRTFETCGSGAFLLCQSNAALGRYFSIGREVEAFNTPEEAGDKIAYYLRNDTSTRRIAAAGRERVLKEHTIKFRVAQMLAMMRSDLSF